jgi:hypothetical protein
MTNGTPTLDEILTEVKLFFEGPINADLMIFASVMNPLKEGKDDIVTEL